MTDKPAEPRQGDSPSRGEYPVLDKSARKAWTTKFQLHVQLLMVKHGLSKPDAMAQAYHEGVETLGKRLG